MQDQLREFFAECGPVTEVRVAYDRDTGRARGFAHVQFETLEGAAAAVALSGQDLGGRSVFIDSTAEREPRECEGRGRLVPSLIIHNGGRGFCCTARLGAVMRRGGTRRVASCPPPTHVMRGAAPSGDCHRHTALEKRRRVMRPGCRLPASRGALANADSISLGPSAVGAIAL